MNRREFLEAAALATAAVGVPAAGAQAASPVPWYRRALRWGQTNITEHDPVHYDIPFWRDFWKRTAIEGVIINAGGIVAYYPSKFPLHHRAEFLNGRDLYGELAQAAHEDGLAVLARMDSNRCAEDFYQAYPDWFARRADGQPYRAEDKYVTCVNSRYYDEYIPGILEEIIQRSHPEGFADNSWSGLTRNSICYCDNCARQFRDRAAQALPGRKNWDDPVYRRWIQWSYARRTAIWDHNNRVTKAAGGPDCLWLGMNSGSITSQSNSFRDFREIARRSEFLLLDHQSRTDATGFQQNGDTGKLVHGLIGWDKAIIESMALYQPRVAAKPAAEAQMWMVEGIAGDIGPWWHIVGAAPEDRRMFRTPERIFQWHRANEPYLTNRRPVASVGLVWSQRNTDYFGRDDAAELVDAPYRGWTQALLRARIPYLPVNISDVGPQMHEFAVLILPNVGAMEANEAEAIRVFAARGGAVIASGATSLYDDQGQPRTDFALADLFGAHTPAPDFGRRPPQQAHTYLRVANRHAVLRGFEDTDIVPFGASLTAMRTDPGVTVPLTFVPPFPVFPPETAWMRTPKTDIPAVVLKGRCAYLPAAIDALYAHGNLPDHGNLLANLVRWAAGDHIGFAVDGAGLIDCHVYSQPGRLIVHLVNLSNEAAWRGPMDEFIPVGPLTVRVRLPQDVPGRGATCLVGGSKPGVAVQQRWATVEIARVVDHEVVVIA
jgi:Hypothetical glycosyl hydrolase 6